MVQRWQKFEKHHRISWSWVSAESVSQHYGEAGRWNESYAGVLWFARHQTLHLWSLGTPFPLHCFHILPVSSAPALWYIEDCGPIRLISLASTMPPCWSSWDQGPMPLQQRCQKQDWPRRNGLFPCIQKVYSFLQLECKWHLSLVCDHISYL